MAKIKTIELSVITPERQVVQETVDSVVMPAHDGELGVLADRAPLMCELGIGTLRYRSGNKSHTMFIDGGFAQVNQNTVTVLTGDAATTDEATPERIAAAERAANQLVNDSAALPAERTRAARRVQALRRAAVREEY